MIARHVVLRDERHRVGAVGGVQYTGSIQHRVRFGQVRRRRAADNHTIVDAGDDDGGVLMHRRTVLIDHVVVHDNGLHLALRQRAEGGVGRVNDQRVVALQDEAGHEAGDIGDMQHRTMVDIAGALQQVQLECAVALVRGGADGAGHNRRIVGAGDADGELRGGAAAVAVRDGIRKRVVDRFALRQRLHCRRGIVQAIGVAAVPVKVQRAVLSNEGAGIDHVQPVMTFALVTIIVVVIIVVIVAAPIVCIVPIIRIGAAIDGIVVRQHVAARGEGAVLLHRSHIGVRNGRIGRAGHGYHQACVVAGRAIASAIGEDVAHDCTLSEALHGIGCVVQRIGVGAIGANDQRAVNACECAGRKNR